ncbi:MAG: hypothetical protein OQJ97_16325 [Rhodospirillales bacterium]|nr:hypothetical protein [Rhodospirillales bacterium]
MQRELELKGECKTFLVARRGRNFQVTLGDTTHEANLRQVQGAEHILTIADKPYRVQLAAEGDNVFVHFGRQAHKVSLTDPLLRAASEAAEGGDNSTAPMPGTVVSISVSAGDTISKGATLLVIESMKLQTTISAWRDGVVAEVNLKEGDTFDRGDFLVSLEPEEE